MRIVLFLFLTGLLTPRTCAPTTNASTCEANRMTTICGLNFTAPSRQFPKNPMPPIQAINANWIAAIPYGYSKKGGSNVSFNVSWQWWGEREIGIRETIRLAKEANIKVLLKPQVYIPGGWVGQMDFNSEEEWKNWEQTYEEYILFFANIASELEVEMFCIGTEYDIAAQKRESFWRALISKIRKKYTGKLVYAANWDAYEQISFWDELDYIGIDTYFPLSKEKTPSVNALCEAWKPIVNRMEKFYCTQKKPILFTEFGYLSVDRCAYNTWELEKNIRSHSINEEAQANAIAALLKVFSAEDWWAGGFLWKWFPNQDGHEGYPSRDYTPQEKKAESVVKTWYSKMQSVKD